MCPLLAPAPEAIPALVPQRLLEREGGSAPGSRLAGRHRREHDDEERGERLLCAACRHGVTRTGWRIAVNGNHEHRFVNPHGILFQIACYRRAPGCAHRGDEVHEYSWFAGYGWRVAICGRCATHLGWGFRSQNDLFHGLIIERLLLEEDDEQG